MTMVMTMVMAMVMKMMVLVMVIRRDICHKHHKQRLCKKIQLRVKFPMVNKCPV